MSRGERVVGVEGLIIILIMLHNNHLQVPESVKTANPYTKSGDPGYNPYTSYDPYKVSTEKINT